MGPIAAIRSPSTARATSSCTASGFATVVLVKTTVPSCVSQVMPGPAPERWCACKWSCFSIRAAVPAPVAASHPRRVRFAALPEDWGVGAEVSRVDVGMIVFLGRGGDRSFARWSEHVSQPGAHQADSVISQPAGPTVRVIRLVSLAPEG